MNFLYSKLNVMPYDLNSLNPQQKEAVCHTEGPLLVLAGAGSGKTRVLTYKIAYLCRERGISPYHILAMTFTNKAAEEMKERIARLLERDVRDLWIGTFHSLCARILRFDGSAAGISSRFTIYDSADQQAVIKKIMKGMNINLNEMKPSTVKNKISRTKNNLETPDEIIDNAGDSLTQTFGEIYRKYESQLRMAGALDFDDLLVKTLKLFVEYTDILEKYQNRYSHLLIDEYQDTNVVQYHLAKLLSALGRNISVVGDDDQSIYRWRGADIRNILMFDEDFPEALVINLEQNYRSTELILNAANNITKRLTNRHEKKLWTAIKGGEKILLLEAGDEIHEAYRVVEHIMIDYDSLKVPLNEIAVLYRTNAQSRAIEDTLRRSAVPYVIVGGTRFYERMEIKDILSYLRLLANPDDIVSFSRAVKTPKRRIGDRTIEKLENFCEEKNIPLSKGLSLLDEIFRGKSAVKKRLADFMKLLDGFRKFSESSGLAELTQRIVDRIKYMEYLKDLHSTPGVSREDNVEELIAAMEQFEESSDNPSLEGFLEEVSLMTDVDRWDDSGDAVTLMTVHSAKGLEFTSVYITGMEKGLFPLERFDTTEEDLEEERRLCYVGITRAKMYLRLSFANFRYRYGSMSGGPSGFINDIPEHLVESDRMGAFAKGNAVLRKKQKVTGVMEFEDYSQEHEGSFSNDSSANVSAAEESTYRVGATVMHTQWGVGRIIESEGSGKKLKVTVQFEMTRKKLMVEYANLEIL